MSSVFRTFTPQSHSSGLTGAGEFVAKGSRQACPAATNVTAPTSQTLPCAGSFFIYALVMRFKFCGFVLQAAVVRWRCSPSAASESLSVEVFFVDILRVV